MIAKAQEKYQKLMEKAQTRVEKLKEKNDSRAEQLLDKLSDRQLKHQQLMENLEEKMPNLTEEQKQKLEQLREQALERYSQFVEKVEQHKEKVRERLEKVIDNNNEQMNLRRLKIMEQLGDKLENENLKEGLIEAKEAMREKIEEFKVSLENLGGEGEGYGLRVLNFLDERLDQRAVLEKTLNKFGQKLEEVKNQKVNQLKARLETATDQLRTELLKPLQSGEIHSVEVLEAVKAKLTNPRAIEALENAQEKQIEQFNRRIEKIEDPVRIEKLKEQVEERPAIKRNIQKVYMYTIMKQCAIRRLLTGDQKEQ